MPAQSKAQQQAAAIALHAPASQLKGASKEMAKMSKADLEKFAKTKHSGLPKHKKEEALRKLKEFIQKTIKECMLELQEEMSQVGAKGVSYSPDGKEMKYEEKDEKPETDQKATLSNPYKDTEGYYEKRYDQGDIKEGLGEKWKPNATITFIQDYVDRANNLRWGVSDDIDVKIIDKDANHVLAQVGPMQVAKLPLEAIRIKKLKSGQFETLTEYEKAYVYDERSNKTYEVDDEGNRRFVGKGDLTGGSGEAHKGTPEINALKEAAKDVAPKGELTYDVPPAGNKPVKITEPKAPAKQKSPTEPDTKKQKGFTEPDKPKKQKAFTDPKSAGENPVEKDIKAPAEKGAPDKFIVKHETGKKDEEALKETQNSICPTCNRPYTEETKEKKNA